MKNHQCLSDFVMIDNLEQKRAKVVFELANHRLQPLGHLSNRLFAGDFAIIDRNELII